MSIRAGLAHSRTLGRILHVGSTADGTLTVKAGGVVSNTNGNNRFLFRLNGRRNDHRVRFEVDQLGRYECGPPGRGYAER